MTTGILVLNFGEPEDPTLEAVVPFLERIFYANARLEAQESDEARRQRSRELAERRAPGLIEEYREIGGSPMNRQANAQARALAEELGGRGVEAEVRSAFQFTEPLVREVVEQMRDAGIQRIVALPIYPLCGPSTNVAALDRVREALEALDWTPELRGISGWHRHPLYLELRADSIRHFAGRDGVDLADPETRVVFSAHGTPRKYLDEGSRYVEYVEEFCGEMGARLSLERYEIGYQNHTNRGIAWTEPDVEDVIRTVRAKRVVVDAISFMHEQSETLAELDHELREEAEDAGLEFHRVPVPHEDPRFGRVLADLAESALSGSALEGLPELASCRCRPTGDTFCFNAVSQAAARSGLQG